MATVVSLWFLFLLLVVRAEDLQTQQQECKYRVDGYHAHHMVYDFNSLKNDKASYQYVDESDGSIYEATFCDSFRLVSLLFF